MAPWSPCAAFAAFCETLEERKPVMVYLFARPLTFSAAEAEFVRRRRAEYVTGCDRVLLMRLAADDTDQARIHVHKFQHAVDAVQYDTALNKALTDKEKANLSTPSPRSIRFPMAAVEDIRLDCVRHAFGVDTYSIQ